MKTKFDKIYVVSLITNKDRQEFIKYQFDELGLDFEFIYGIDYYNFNNIEWPDVYINTINNCKGDGKDFGCAMTHYQAVMQAYHLGYNNVLIFEDDVCMNKDKHMIEDMLNNIPEDADYIDYDPRQYLESYQQQLLKIINNINSRYFKINKIFYGAAMFGIMNRKTMKLYLDSQHNCLKMSDNVDNFVENKTIQNYYISTKCLFVAQHTLNKIFNKKNYSFAHCYDNMYLRSNKYKKEDFFEPKIYHEWSRDNII